MFMPFTMAHEVYTTIDNEANLLHEWNVPMSEVFSFGGQSVCCAISESNSIPNYFSEYTES